MRARDTTWRDKPMCGFDTETDSPNPEEARIITACAGWASVDGWAPINWVLKPERPIPAEAQAIHGITTEYAEEYGVDRKVGLAQIRDALEAAWALESPVVIYNAPYDTTTLDRELRRVGERPLRVSGPVLDPLVLDKAVDRYRKGSRKLVDVAAHYGVPLGADAHGAEADALASCRIAWRIAGLRPQAADWSKTGDGEPPLTLAEMCLRDLHAFQVEAFEEQRRSFIEHRRRKGEPLDDESLDWPIRPFAPQSAAA